MRRGMWLGVAVASCAIALTGCAGIIDNGESTGSSQSADTVCVNGTCTTTYVGVLRTVDIFTGAITLETPSGKLVTLTHTVDTIHVGVVPGPMRGVVPGPMHGLERAWDNAVAQGATERAFLILLERFAFGSTTATLTTTDNLTIASVQPQP